MDAYKYGDLNLSNKFIELMVLELSQKETKPFILLTVYRPPQGRPSEFMELIRNVFRDLPANVNVVVTGDVNINYLEDSVPKKELKNIEKEFNLKQWINVPTRYTRKNSTLIDHIYSNYESFIAAGILDYYISDHQPTYITIKKSKSKYETTTFMCRSLKNLDSKRLEEQFENVDWDKYYEYDDPDKCWDFILNTIIKLLDEMCPEHSYSNVRKKSQWINLALFELMTNREEKHKVAKQSKEDTDWEAAKEARNLVNEQCKFAKCDFVKNKLNENSGNTRKFWEQLKPLVNEKDNTQSEKIELDGAQGNEAEMFNTFFANVGIDLQKQIPQLSVIEKRYLDNRDTSDKTNVKKNTFKFQRILDIEIKEIVKNIKVHKSSGIPTVSSYLIKLCFGHLL